MVRATTPRSILLEDIFQWDVLNWSRALGVWQRFPLAGTGQDLKALAVGEREGGLSLWLASSGYSVHCTDLHGPAPEARTLHAKHGVQAGVVYEAQDITALTYPAGTFDVVVFKSVIGALSAKERQQQALAELLRVLRPGGSLYFAENLAGTWAHRWLRKRFVRWDSYWRYLRWPEDADLLDGFEQLSAARFGFLANLGRSEAQRRFLGRIDTFLGPLVPASWRYILVVVARKPVPPPA